MDNKALVGIDPNTMVVEIVASMKSHSDEHIGDIMGAGFLPVVTTIKIARDTWGTKLDNIFDLLSA